MIVEIVNFPIPDNMSDADIQERFEATAPVWKANPDLMHKSYLHDKDRKIGGGVYLWKHREAATAAHDAAWIERITGVFGAPTFQYFDSPVQVNNLG